MNDAHSIDRRRFLLGTAAAGCAVAARDNVSAAEDAAAVVRNRNGYPTLFIDGVSRPAHFYYFPLPVKEHIAGFARAGIHQFTWGWGSHINHSMDMGWTGAGRQDFVRLDREAETILAADPEAYLVPRIGVAAPPWWLELHPEHRVRFHDGTTVGEDGKETNETSPASLLWRAEAGEALTRLIRHVRGRSYGTRVIGFQVTGGMNEWFYHFGTKFPDFSPPAITAFRAWLRAKYGDDAAALRRAWKAPAVQFETARPPAREERLRTTHNLLRDPAASCCVADYLAFLSEANADAVIHFCRIVKRAGEGRFLAGAFYGYLLNAAAGYSKGLAPVNWGHNALRRVLAAPEIDFLCAPNHYTWTGPGGYGGSQSVPDSVQLAGKLWMSEMDQLTFLGRSEATMRNFARRPFPSPMPDKRQTLDRMTRDFAHCFIQRYGLWWMEQDRGFCRYQHPEILALVGRMERLMHNAADLDVRRNAEICVLIDEETPHHLKPGVELLNPLRYAQVMYHLCRIGAPFDLRLHNDLERSDVPDYRLYLFLDTLYLTGRERELLRRVVHRRGKTALWVFAPGIIGDDGLRIEHVAELTGMRVKMALRGDWGDGGPLQQCLADFEHPITRGIRPGTVFGTDAAIGPMVFVDDPDARVLGKLLPLHEREGPPGFAVKQLTQGKSIFCAVPNLPSDLLRNIARFAGCHVYADEDDVVYANSRFLAIHALRGGQKRIRLRQRTDVYDALTGSAIARGVDQFEDRFDQCGTRLYRLDLVQ
jgi:hypothetical protein